MTFYKQARATNISTLYYYFNRSQSSRPVENTELFYDWLNNSRWSKFSVARAFRQTVVRNYNRAKAMCSNMMYLCETIIYKCHWKKNPVSVVPSIVKRICGHLKSAGYSDALHVGFNSRTHSTFFILSIVNCKG